MSSGIQDPVGVQCGFVSYRATAAQENGHLRWTSLWVNPLFPYGMRKTLEAAMPVQKMDTTFSES